MTDQITDERIEEWKKKHPPIPAEKWNTDGCVDLAAAIIQEAKMSYISAKIGMIELVRDRPKLSPLEYKNRFKEASRTYELAKEFFYTRYFTILSLGQVESNDMIKYLDKEIERKYKYAYQSGKNPAAQAIMREFERDLRAKEP